MKYMGSKSKIAKHIIPIMQKCIDDNNITSFIDMFCGGCNIVDKIKCENRFANDNNKYLIALFKNLDRLEYLPAHISKEHYSEVRDEYNKCKNSLLESKIHEDGYIGAIGFLASYNGRFFDGGYAQSGYENTKYGKKFRDYYQEAYKNLLKQREDLLGVKFSCKDYTRLKDVKNYFIYLDPPYEGTKQYLTSKGFNHDYFWEWVKNISKDNYVVVSEESSRAGFEVVWKQEVARTIKAKDKSKSTEKLFTHKDGLFYKYYIETRGKTCLHSL